MMDQTATEGGMGLDKFQRGPGRNCPGQIILGWVIAALVGVSVSSVSWAKPTEAIIRTESEFQLASGETGKLQITSAQGPQAVNETLQDALEHRDPNEIRLIVSDTENSDLTESLQKLGPTLRLAVVPPAVEKAQRESLKKSERVESIIWASAISSVRALSVIFLSKMTADPATATIAIATFFSFYFQMDVERWNDFQYRWLDIFTKGLNKVGLSKMTNGKAFQEVTKTIIAFVGNSAFSAMYIGLGLWQNVMSELALNPSHMFERIGLSALISTFLAQPYDAVFQKWLKDDETKLSRHFIHQLMRLRSLLSVAIMPLVFNDLALGYAGAGVLFTGGLLLSVKEFGGPKLVNWAKLKWSQLKKAFTKPNEKPCENYFKRSA